MDGNLKEGLLQERPCLPCRWPWNRVACTLKGSGRALRLLLALPAKHKGKD